MVHIVPHATDLGISPIVAANILAIIGGITIVGKIGMGIASDRIGNKLSFITSFIVLSVALFLLFGASELWTFYLFAIIFGFGYGGLAVLLSPVVAEFFGLRALGIILGVVLFASTIGELTGPLLAGHIFDVASSYQLAFLLCAILSVTGLVLAFVLKPITREGRINGAGRST